MLFNSYIFLIFFIIVTPIYYFSPKKIRGYVLLFSSYIFYGYWDWRFCLLLGFTTLSDFYISKMLDSNQETNKRKKLLYLSIGTNILILGFFKYFNFFIDTFDAIIKNFGLNLNFLHINVILPVGISFYTFKSLAYVIDVYYKRAEPAKSILDYAIFLSFFPQLVAGPIERAKNILPQIMMRSRPTFQQIQSGFLLITIGMFKKVLIGDTCGRFVDHIFARPEYYTSPELLSALVLFAIQVYADFSGYSQIAIGTAKFFGVDTMENFKQPYLSSSITEFWRRWHISLTTWLRDYLFLPMAYWFTRKLDALKLKPKYVHYGAYTLSMILTMLVGGLWHGANFTFVVWGGLHGVFLAIHKIIMGKKKIYDHYIYRGFTDFLIFILKVTGTFILVLFTWLFFRSESFNQAFFIVQNIINWQGSEFALRFFVITLTYLFLMVFIDVMEYTFSNPIVLLKIKSAPFRFGVCLSIWLVVLLFMFQSKPMPFVYFQF